MEAIALFEITPTKHRLYISNEKFAFSSGPITFNFPAKLWNIEIDAATVTLNVQDIDKDVSFSIYPNPVDKALKLSKKVDEIIIFDVNGKSVAKQQFVEEISLENLNKGFYIAHFKIGNSIFVKQLIKK